MCAVLLMLAALALPLVRILATLLALRITAALIEPFAEPQLTKAIGDVADVLGYLFAIVAGRGADVRAARRPDHGGGRDIGISGGRTGIR